MYGHLSRQQPGSEVALLDEDSLRWVLLPQVDSTNSYMLRSSFPSGTVCLARSQTAGRGRRGRIWSSVPGHSFIFSALLAMERSDAYLERLRYLPLLAGAALLVAARGHWRRHISVQFQQAQRQQFQNSSVRFQFQNSSVQSQPLQEPVLALKWPNDLYLTRRNGHDLATGKLAGILVESEIRGAELRVVLGAGLNWSGNISHFAAGIASASASTSDRAEGREDSSQEATSVSALSASMAPESALSASVAPTPTPPPAAVAPMVLYPEQDFGGSNLGQARPGSSGIPQGQAGPGDPRELAPFFVKAINARLPLLYSDVAPLLQEVREYFYLRDRIVRIKGSLYRVKDLAFNGGLSLEELSSGKIENFCQTEEQMEIVSDQAVEPGQAEVSWEIR